KLQLAPAKRRPVLASSIKADNALWWEGQAKAKNADAKKPTAPGVVVPDDFSFYEKNAVSNPDKAK
ncbi:MAG: hypothetical protein WCH57_11815, partial [Verrucomicrobiota bacterium]